ncbi:hypothetical protein CPB84DRAFT_1791089 [Gymnopilus junonius]|uniref:Uncharacterized protein n=1 Tax=Gymnopilus junonius TaxID=109634 RepID=A0A9P5NFP9_GYMJU|nr:hypothetical protein CPB84DRAFT_1791089 [Gymnopilus junonius]
METKSTTTKPKCAIAEILQHTCQLKTTHDGNPLIQCFPIPRILRICPGQPAVEITKLVNIDMKNGEIEMPQVSSLDLVKGRPWREIVRYETDQPVSE